MDPIIFYPDPRFKTKVKVAALLLMVVTVFWWSIPVTFLAGYELSGIALGLILVLIGHGALIWITFWATNLYYNSIRYEIHPDEVVVIIGIVTKSVKHVPFRTVTNLKVTRGPLDRIFGLGTLAIQTAGASGSTSSAEESLEGLADVQGVYDLVVRELRRFRGGMSPTQTGEDTMPAAPGMTGDSGTLGAILDELRAIRARMEQ